MQPLGGKNPGTEKTNNPRLILPVLLDEKHLAKLQRG